MLQRFKHIFFKPPRKKIGLALGSGGAKGLAHIGVIKVLVRNNIPIDMIAGTSIGALIGGSYAKLEDINEIEDIVRNSNYKELLKVFLNPSRGAGLVKGTQIEEFLKNKVGTIDIEDLNIPFSAVATNIKTGNEVIIDKGDLVETIRASLSVPVLFSPVTKEEHTLVDGAISNPVPVDVVKKMGADIVIAVNLNNARFVSQDKKISSLSMASTAVDLLSYNLAKEKTKMADIVISPEIGSTSWLKFSGGIDLIQKGEEAALKVLPQIKKIIDQK